MIRPNHPGEVVKIHQLFNYTVNGWRNDVHARLIGPTNTASDGAMDLIGCGLNGVYVSKNTRQPGEWTPGIPVLSSFGAAQTWDAKKHIRWVADLRKVGYVDLIGFGTGGVYICRGKGDGTFETHQLVLNDLGTTAGGWSLEKHLRFLTDATGDGFLDILGFGNNGVGIAKNKGDGTFHGSIAASAEFGYNQGWRVETHERLLGDITGDGKPDIVAFKEDGVITALNKGDGTFAPGKHVLNFFGNSTNPPWTKSMHPRMLADVNGNGRMDIVGFGDWGVWVAFSKGDGTFEEPKQVSQEWGYLKGNWRVETHRRWLVDVNGNGTPDIVGVGYDALLVSYNDGAGNFGPSQQLSKFFNTSGASGTWTRR